MKRVKANRINNVITAVIAVLAIWFIGITLIPKFFGLSGYFVKTKSMEPTIKIGSLVFTKEVKFDEIKVGDVLTFQSYDMSKRFTHRVVEIDTDNMLLYTKGDANNIVDPEPAKYDSVLGKVTLSIPFLGYLVMALRTRIGAVIFFSVIIVWVSIEIEVFKLKRKGSRKSDEKKNF